MILFLTCKHQIISLIPLIENIPNYNTHPCKPQKMAFLLERRMEEELLNCRPNTSLASKTELSQERAPHKPLILTLPKEMIKIFLHLPTKNTTERPNKRASPPNKPINSVHTSKQNLPDKEAQFLRNLNPPNNVKSKLSKGRGIQQQREKGLT